MKNKIFVMAVMFMIAIIFPFNFIFAGNGNAPALFGIRGEFIIFALTLLGVALFHQKTMWIALGGLFVTLLFKFSFDSSFNLAEHFVGSAEKEGEWLSLLNLTGLLFGFAILAKIFEESNIPGIIPKYLPNNWTGGLLLLFAIMFISSFLDNIAAAILGGTIAGVLYKGKVHIGYLAAIVAASNAGGAGSVVGDTTTTLMWIDGVHPMYIFKAFIASFAAFAIFGVIGSIQQSKFQPQMAEAPKDIKVDYVRLLIVVLLLGLTITTNYLIDLPAAGVWIAILISIPFRPVPWKELPNAFQGTIFLLSLVSIASMMPVNELPAASWQTALSMGFVSAVFDNIPLTKLCLEQGGYDWGFLAYAVGFGGSMIWFGSSAGVALSNLFPQTKSVVRYVKNGWHVTLAYIVGFFVLLLLSPWNSHYHKASSETKNSSDTSQVNIINPSQSLNNGK